MRTRSKAGDWRIFEPLATVKDQPRRGKGLDPDREKTCDWSRQGGRFTAKKNESQKVSYHSFATEKKRYALYQRDPVNRRNSSIRSRQLRWARN